MQCLIIAAGQGKRLAARGDSKPLVALLGLSLIERVILSAQESGLHDFYVVTGYNSEKVEAFLEKLGRERGLKITTIVNEEWDRENGLSVLKAKPLLTGNFVLLMVDHLFDPAILQQLQQQPLQEDEVILAVDERVQDNPFVDMADVTKVYIQQDRIRDIGKHIPLYNAYDTGIFLCSPAIFSALETSMATRNDSSLSGGIKVLAEKGCVKPFPIGQRFWIDLDDEAALHKAETVLLDQLRKPSDGPVSRYINRPISTRITRYLVQRDISPNQISVLSFLLSLLASLFFFLGSDMARIAGAICTQISSIIDGCDGEVARLKHRQSDFGKWFDAVLDRYADGFLLSGLTYYALLARGDLLPFYIGFLALIGSFVNSYTADKYDGLMRRRLGPRQDPFRIGRDIRLFLIFIGALLNSILLTLLCLALLMNLENIRRVVLCYRHA
ncbi:MAG: hypothetical protein D6736_15975 [Nitrospinota bacterium]|nr:MAG: hypothetical protein D6736_15975 [Nitrospinota bacterium]